MRHLLVAAIFLTSILSAADWAEPRDGKFTEKQLENYIASQKEIYQFQKAYGKAIEGSQGLSALSAAATYNDRIAAIWKKNSLQPEEFAWVAGKVLECLGISIVDDTIDKAKVEL